MVATSARLGHGPGPRALSSSEYSIESPKGGWRTTTEDVVAADGLVPATLFGVA
jgi:hypothetical protein